MDFIKKNVYVIICAFCVLALGAAYVYERRKPAAVYRTGGASVTLYDADNAGEEPDKASVDVSPRITEAQTVKVYITGAVEQPGVYELPADARVDDVLKLAGGATGEADLLRVNLAAHISDAQQIYIPKEGDPPETETMINEGNIVSGDEATSDSTLVNINTAGLTALQTLPGIGPTLAQYIIDYREAHGPYSTIDDIKNVSRIGEATFDKIKDSITVK